MNDEQFERYLELIHRLYNQMKRTGEWPWTDESDFDAESKERNQTRFE